MNARKAIAALALTAVPFAGVVGLTAHSAEAQPVGGSGGAKKCDMEVDGKTVKVDVGTRVGLFYCGSDGEWHFGLIQLDWRVASPTTNPPTTPPVVKATQANQAVKAVQR